MPENHNENLPLKENGIAGEEAMETAIVKPRHRWTKYQKLHLAITLVLVAVCIALIGIYVIELSSRKKADGSDSKTGCKNKKKVCESPECVAIAAQVLQYADHSVDPCKNFYEYACGGWKKRRYIPDSKPSWDTFSDLSEANDKLLKKTLIDGKPNTTSPAEGQLYKLYSSCLSTTVIDDLGLQPLKDLFVKMELWSALNGTWNESSWDMIESLVRVHSIFSPIVYMETEIPFFDIRVGVDILNSSQQIIKISQPRSTILSLDDQSKPDFKDVFADAIVNVVKMLGVTDVGSSKKDVTKLDTEILQGFVSNDQYRKVQESRVKMTIKELNNATNNKFDWLRYLQLAFKKTGMKITEQTEVAIQPLGYLKKMVDAVSKASKKTIANYFAWSLIAEMKDYLPTKITKTFFEIEKKKTGAQEPDPRWQRCLRKVEASMGMALGALLIKEKFSGEDKKEVETMIENIKNAFLSIVQNTDWMDEETRNNGMRKARAVIGNIAYPSFIKDPVKLAKYYNGISLGEKRYFDNMVQLLTKEKEKDVMKLKTKVDRQEWELPPSLVNAFYDPGRNRMVFMAGILQSPFFNRNAPKPINYGGIGVVMGHELSHGFDDQGRLFDEKGNMKSWWSKKSTQSFKERAKCIKKQYSSYSLFGLQVNENLTLGENIADNSGIKTAFNAYKKLVEKDGPSRALPGVNMTDDQLFFLASAQIWCSIERTIYTKTSLKLGTHSPAVFRVSGPLSNSEDFAKAYNCPAGSLMNPEKKCSIW